MKRLVKQIKSHNIHIIVDQDVDTIVIVVTHAEKVEILFVVIDVQLVFILVASKFYVALNLKKFSCIKTIFDCAYF